ncbi:dicarboxylate transporter/tellurite-resistance protein TehA [Dyella solisilvae]|uniref:Dicarboxylate transporter/tellurite-resistance protein TehA n=1 Tax=Dyella solisilvae TaxID=1920168 RepID=A0A370K4F1_9GAMM|nr:dicarboxylate transporter/tellurite-resistance protein TehA [Dyella solisilvae]RDI97504.1 dicarboxylate transporter/tellurite-resistance protein TehA [Dyella solisilvae]
MNADVRTPIVPANFFGIVLGVIGLGNAWRLAHQVWGLRPAIGEVIELIGTLVWLVLVTLYVFKWIFARARAIDELHHPVQCCFVGLIGVSTMVVAGAANPYSHTVAVALLAVGSVYTIAFGAWRTGGLWQGGREIGHTTAVLYLPTVAGAFVAAAVLAALGYADWGQLAFGAGLFSWIALESVLVHRLFTADALPPVLRPTLGIQLAPPAVGAVSYLAVAPVAPGAPDLFAHALLGYALLQLLILSRMLPWIRQQPFGASYWAFTFGISALAIAPLRMIQRGETGPAALLAPWLFVLANVVIGAVAAGTIYLLLRGRLIPATPAATSPSSTPSAAPKTEPTA